MTIAEYLQSLNSRFRLGNATEHTFRGDLQNLLEFFILVENEVEKIKFEDGKIYINAEQYFDGVPEIAWNFYIGGYQPAQKWLKDRKGRTLDFEDIMHYQQIIKVLFETERVMREIDGVEVV